ncbi:nucleotidyltransferase substrate binding protein [Candidatus Parcubacteria bacterium]|nr:nucleotidyltransferase substrate binding protein [Candidatus Parcubacteria bacterium]
MTKLQSLREDLVEANQRLKEASNLEPTRIHKDATIQRFEFTFELVWKTIQEYIRDQGFDCKSPKSCFRTAAEIDLIEDIEIWFEYLKARNLIAHTYNEKLSNEVYDKAVKFHCEVDNLLKEFE